jgi:hypothetical protein
LWFKRKNPSYLLFVLAETPTLNTDDTPDGIEVSVGEIAAEILAPPCTDGFQLQEAI